MFASLTLLPLLVLLGHDRQTCVRRRPKCVDVCSEPNRSPFWLMFSVCDPYGGIVLFFVTFFVCSFWFTSTRVGNVCESLVSACVFVHVVCSQVNACKRKEPYHEGL